MKRIDAQCLAYIKDVNEIMSTSFKAQYFDQKMLLKGTAKFGTLKVSKQGAEYKHSRIYIIFNKE